MIRLKNGGGKSPGSGKDKKPSQRKCSHSGESWPEHLMTMIAGRWVSKSHATEFNTEFIRKKKSRKKTIVACVLLLAGAGGFFYWKHNQSTMLGAAEGITSDTKTALKSIVGVIAGDNGNGLSGSEQELHDRYTATAQRILDKFDVEATAVTPPNQGASWASLPLDGWPAMTLHNNVSIKRGGIFVGGNTFLAQRADDSVIAFADASILNPNHEQAKYEEILRTFANDLETWEVSVKGDKKKRMRFDTAFGDPDKLMEQISRFNGRLLLSRSAPPASLPTIPLKIDRSIPAVGETVFVIGSRAGAAGVEQVVRIGVLVEVNTTTHNLTVGYEQTADSVKFQSIPVLNSSGHLIGIVEGTAAMISAVMPAGMGLLSTSAAFHFAAEVNGE